MKDDNNLTNEEQKKENLIKNNINLNSENSIEDINLNDDNLLNHLDLNDENLDFNNELKDNTKINNIQNENNKNKNEKINKDKNKENWEIGFHGIKYHELESIMRIGLITIRNKN